ncbi:MAG: peptide MFS transporter [Planctomycetaceae bacterium]|jgi:dipeptide/tripeptide permease|nr:peptide MFS transporter [Planctomycetaceae bacterium]
MSNSNNASLQRHPAGLWVLFTTEMWERFAFYAMRAVFVLYLVSVSTDEWTPGFGWSEADAYALYGWYTGLVYFAPLLGGWIADRFIGQRWCVVIGSVLMALGEFFLAATEFLRLGGVVKVTFATDPLALIIFYTGLGLMILGNGFFKPCISAMVGQLYKQGDRRRDSAFTIFYMGINIGAFLSPLVAGTVAEVYGFHFGFLIAGLGMIFGLISFLVFGRNHLKGIGAAPAKHKANIEMTPEEKTEHEKLVYEQSRPLDNKDYDRIYVIVALSIFVIAFWVAFEQAGSSLNIFAKKNTNRNIADSIINVSPEFMKRYFLDNEDVVVYKSVISRLEALEEQASKLGQGQTDAMSIQQESFMDRARRLLSFKKSNEQDKQSIVTMYPLLRERAAGLKERLGTDEDKAVVVQLQKILKNRSDVLQKNFNEDEYKNISDAIDKLNGFFATRSLGLKEHLTEDEYNNIVDEVAKLSKAEEDLGKDFVPKESAFTFPATWYQSVNSLWIIVFAPIFAFLWSFLARRGIEPSTPTKFALGLLLVSAAFLVMIPGAVEAKAEGSRAAPYWLVLCYLFATWGELCVSPVGLSMITKLAPARYVSLFMGVWFTASSIAYILAGQLASKFGSGEGISFFLGEKSGLADFFLLMAIIPMIIGTIALLLSPKLKRMMHGVV